LAQRRLVIVTSQFFSVRDYQRAYQRELTFTFNFATAWPARLTMATDGEINDE
jgi:hypothetical protein